MDNQRPIEKLLREAAKIRRDQAGSPQELHPASRRILQQEVRRCFPPKSGQISWWRTFFGAGLFPRIAWATCLALLVGFVLWIVIPNEPVADDLALQTALPSKPLSPATPSVAPSASPAVPSALFDETAKSDHLLARQEAASESLELMTREEGAVTGGTFETTGVYGGSGGEGAGAALAAPAAPSAAKAYTYFEPSTTQEAVAPLAKTAAPEVSRFGLEDTPAGTMRHAPAAPSMGLANRPTPAQPSRGVATSSVNGTGSTVLGYAAKGLQEQEISERFFMTNMLKNEGLAGLIEPRDRPASGGLATSYFGHFKNFDADLAVVRSEEDKKMKVASKQARQLTQQVLERFRVEQTGSTIRISDQDGSVYAGTLLATSPSSDYARRAILMDARNSGVMAGRSNFSAGTSLGYDTASLGRKMFFRVSGTNRTLGQLVNFSGQLMTNNTPLNVWFGEKLAATLKTNEPVRQIVGDAAVEGLPPFRVNALELKE